MKRKRAWAVTGVFVVVMAGLSYILIRNTLTILGWVLATIIVACALASVWLAWEDQDSALPPPPRPDV